MIKRKTVLVVDDEELIRECIRDILKSRYDILEAEGVDSGIESMSANTVDLVILDIKMVGKDGIEFLREIKKTKVSRSKTLICSGYYEEEGVKRRIKDALPTAHYIKKPFFPEDLTEKVRDLIGS